MKTHFDHKTGKTKYSLTSYERRCILVTSALLDLFRPMNEDLIDATDDGLTLILEATDSQAEEKQEAGEPEKKEEAAKK